jgi:DNA-binding transcriptional ArsR family regulator
MSEAAQHPEEMDRTIEVGTTAAGESYTLPVEDLLTGRTFITGKSGSGKSNTGSVVAEELLAQNLPLLVVDVDGEYWGLKEEFELLHVGATEECDLQVGPEHAGKLAELALEQLVPIILDVSGYLDDEEADALVRETARELFKREQSALQPFLMLVEEIHEYIPEGGGLDETGKMLIRVAKRGRKRGLGVMGLSQRPADVKKDFITQADLLVWHRLTWDNDTDVVKRVIDREHADAIEGLADGEAFVQADWSDVDVERVQFRRKHTFDAGATPGLDDVDRPDLKAIDADLVDELEDISEQHERRQDRIAELEARLEEKDERIAELEADLEDARDLQRLGEAFIDAAENRGGGGEVDRELLEEKNETIADLRERVDALEAEAESLREERDELADEVDRLQGAAARVERAEKIERMLEEVRDVVGVDVETTTDAGDEDELRGRLQDAHERIDDLEAENERLREQDGVAVAEAFSEALDFLRHDAVQETVERAAENSQFATGHYWDVLFYLADDDVDTAHPETLTAVVDLHQDNIGKLLKRLAEKNVVASEQDGRRKVYRLNVEGLTGIVEQHQKRQQMDEFREEVA